MPELSAHFHGRALPKERSHLHVLEGSVRQASDDGVGDVSNTAVSSNESVSRICLDWRRQAHLCKGNKFFGMRPAVTSSCRNSIKCFAMSLLSSVSGEFPPVLSGRSASMTATTRSRSIWIDCSPIRCDGLLISWKIDA